MMFAFAIRMFRDKYKSFIVYSLSAIGFVEMYIALFPSIRQQSGQIDQMIRTFPPEMFKAMNMDPSTLSFSTLESYLSTEFMSFLWPILAIIFVLSIANYISVNEIDKGTIETLVSLPAKRIRIFVERYFMGLILIAGFCVISIFGAIPFAILHNTDYIFANFVTAAVGSFLFAWAVYSLAVLSSVIFSEKGKASMVTSGVIILMYVMNVISSLNDGLKNLHYFSFFNYFNGSDLLAKNIYPEYIFWVLGGFALVATLIAAAWFNRRDLSV
jgi:ABC-2 type transport system permease protein